MTSPTFLRYILFLWCSISLGISSASWNHVDIQWQSAFFVRLLWALQVFSCKFLNARQWWWCKVDIVLIMWRISCMHDIWSKTYGFKLIQYWLEQQMMIVHCRGGSLSDQIMLIYGSSVAHMHVCFSIWRFVPPGDSKSNVQCTAINCLFWCQLELLISFSLRLRNLLSPEISLFVSRLWTETHWTL